MKSIIKKIISIVLYAIAIGIFILALSTFSTSYKTISDAIASGQYTWSSNAMEFISFLSQNTGTYFFQAIVIGYIAYALSTSTASTTKESHTATSVNTLTIPEIETVDTTVASPLTLVDGKIKTHLEDSFIKLNSYTAEVLFNSKEKIEILEAYDSKDGSKEVVVFNAKNTWSSLEAALVEVLSYYEVELDEATSTYTSEKLLISKNEKYGNANGFYVVELAKENESYLLLDIDASIYVVRYSALNDQKELVKELEKMVVAA